MPGETQEPTILCNYMYLSFFAADRTIAMADPTFLLRVTVGFSFTE